MQPDSDPQPEARPSRRRRRMRRLVPWLVFLLVLLLALLLHRCPSPPPPIPQPPLHTSPPPAAAPPETSSAKLLPPPKPVEKRKPHPPPAPTPPVAAAVSKNDTLPFVYADPWGGRHFDSVRVTLHCRENCVVLYSLEDSVHFRSYDSALTFRRNTTLWMAGETFDGRQTPPVRLEYVIEKNRGECPSQTMPVKVDRRTVCVDEYEWPNREGAWPQTMVSQAQAEDSCQAAGKRLCTREEWQDACQGPDQSRYPYGTPYDERYCPAQQTAPARSGRSPACRSYYGIYDLTGNVWEWTATPDSAEDDFFWVAGGDWETAEKATCRQAKFSFYPQNRYPSVGFRCCEEPK